MNDSTLESFAKRVEALEKAIAPNKPEPPRKDWRKVVGMFRDSEFMRQVAEWSVAESGVRGDTPMGHPHPPDFIRGGAFHREGGAK